MVGARHHGLAAGAFYGLRDLLAVGRDLDGADPRLAGAPPDMHDHRLAGDRRERLVRQAGRREPLGDEDDGVAHQVFRWGAALRTGGRLGKEPTGRPSPASGEK